MPGTGAHVIGVDNAAFKREHRGNVLIVGAVFSGARLDGVLTDYVRRDGRNATDVIAAMISRSRFAPQLQAVLLQGIAFAGFNVIDLHALHRKLGLAIAAVARKQPDLDAIKRALLGRVRGGERKWRLIERAGPMQPVAGIYAQAVGIEMERLADLIERHAIYGRLPEPLRVAHMIAAGLSTGESRHRA